MTLTVTFMGAAVTIFGMFASAFVALAGVALGGFLVLRSRGNGYEPLLPPLRGKTEEVAVNMDDLIDEAAEEISDSFDAEIEKILNQRGNEDPNRPGSPVDKANDRMKGQQSHG